uniref:Rx N-terminal domain-containing protein n=1 Tax=Fagus sylvatica TaxID=28930 RepID=A0A2N9HI74_FAGSY
MAEGALFHLAGKVLDVLGSFILQKLKLASGVETEIENLRDTVSTIHAVILDAEKKSSHSHQIKDWLRKLKDVLHDADDLLDDFYFEVLRHKVMTKKQVRLFCSSSNQLAFSPKMGHKIEAIRKRLNAIADGRKFHLDESSIEPQVMNRDRETYSFVHEEDVIGRDDDKKEITKLLLDDNVVENISIIPIVGLGGLGKTTLAQLVYNDENVSKNFELKLWICVSDIFDATGIVKEILKQLKKKKREGSLENLEQLKMKMHEAGSLEILAQLKEHERSFEILGQLTKHEESLENLQNQLREKLNRKKYLLVLDDLWNEDNNKWFRLRDLLMFVVGSKTSLRELKELSSLGGNLFIRGLGHGKDDMVECKATNMKEKQHLQQLGLIWDLRWDRETECYDEESLEGLQPHPNLKALELFFCMGVRIPNWLSSLTNLVSLGFSYNKRLQHLPPLNKLPFLKSLRFEHMEALEYISEEEEEDSVSNVFGGSSSSSSKTIEFFPSLSSLELGDCPNLKGWWRKDYDNELLLPSFPCLSKLEIAFCPKLTSMPLFPYLKENLKLCDTSSKVLQQTMKMGTRQRASTATTSTSTSSSSCFPLSQLQFLELKDFDLESLPEEWLGNLTSLQRLQILFCDNLTSFPEEGLRNLTSLQHLEIANCPNLTSFLEEGLRNLTSLQLLEIRNCPNLTSLSQGIRNLTSLQHLSIRSCPILGQRCQRQTGEDWPNIAHVPIVIVDGVDQQQETIPSSLVSHLTSHAERIKFQTLFKTVWPCNCATCRELSEMEKIFLILKGTIYCQLNMQELAYY